MEANYAIEAVGEALSKGLVEVVAVRPADPIEYLAHWLKTYRENELKDNQVEQSQQSIGQLAHSLKKPKESDQKDSKVDEQNQQEDAPLVKDTPLNQEDATQPSDS